MDVGPFGVSEAEKMMDLGPFINVDYVRSLEEQLHEKVKVSNCFSGLGCASLALICAQAKCAMTSKGVVVANRSTSTFS